MEGEKHHTTLGDVTEWMSGGTPSKGNPDFWNGDIPWISARSMKATRLECSDRMITATGLAQGSRLADSKTILILVRGSELHKRIPIGITTQPLAFNQDVKALRAKDPLLPEYLLYWLLAHEELLLNMVENTGIGAGKLDTQLLKSLPFLLPTATEQHAIAHILGTLDDKIELNRRMNETLEGMARALFKSWFVDFDPVRAKMEGRWKKGESLPGMPAHLWVLFPDKLVESELGEIPEGWRVASLTDCAETLDCLHSKKPCRQETGQLLIQLENVTDDGHLDFSKPFHISDEDFRVWTKRMEVLPGNLVITKTGRVGAVAQMPKGYRAAMGRNLVGLRCIRTSCGPRFLRDLLLSDRMRQEMIRNTNDGTILRSLHVKAIERLRLVLPPRPVTTVYENTASDYHDRQDLCNEETRVFSALRDTLLPKLISGELRVRDAEQHLENVQ